MGSVKQFIESIKLREGLRFDGQVAKVLGISRGKLANWKIRDSLPVEYQQWYCDKYDIKLKDFHKDIETNKQVHLEKEDHKVDKDYIIGLQKEKIEVVEAKLQEKKLELDYIKTSPIQNALWEELTPSFRSEVLIKPKLKWFAMGMMINQDKLPNIETLADALEMTKDQILKYFDPGVWHEWGKSPVEKLIIKDSKDYINDNIPMLEKTIDFMKNLVGDHYYNQTVVYRYKNKIAVTHCAVIIKWWEKPKRVLSKNTIIDIQTID